MRYLRCSGTPRAMGVAQGQALAGIIHERLQGEVAAVMADGRRRVAGFDDHVARVHAQTLAYLDEKAPAIVQEMQGIAQGAAISFDESLLLSTYNALSFPDRIVVDGCSAVALARTAAGPLIMKTNDTFGSAALDTPQKRQAKVEQEAGVYFVLRAEHEDGRVTLSMRLAGSVWADAGLNSAGLAFGSASLHPRLYPQTPRAVPQHMLGLIALQQCRSVAQVRALMPTLAVYGKGFAMAFVDAGGDGVGVEKTARFTGFNEPQQGVCYQTNHLRSPAMMELGRQQDQAFWGGSYCGNSQARAAMIERRRERWISHATLEALVADLYQSGGSGDLIQDGSAACQHWLTAWAGLLLAMRGQFWATRGWPGQRDFQCFSLSETAPTAT